MISTLCCILFCYSIDGKSSGAKPCTSGPCSLNCAGVRAATDSRQLLDSRVHSSLVVAYSRVRHTRVGRTLKYAKTGLYSQEYILP